MHAAVRPYATAGVALLGAGVIAVTPVAGPLPDVHIPTLHADVALTQATNAYEEVFQTAAANVQTIFNTFLANPTPILSQILSNQSTALQALLASGGAFTIPSLSQIITALTGPTPALQNLLPAIQTTLGTVSTALTTAVPPLLQTAFGDLTSANVEGAINNVLLAGFTALFPLAGVLGPTTQAITEPLQNLVSAIDLFGPVATTLANPLQNVLNVLNNLFPENGSLLTQVVVAGLIAPLFATPAAFGTAIQGVINAIGAGNPTNVLTAIADAPAVFLGGLLNGEVDGTPIGPDVGSLVSASLGLPVNTFFGGLLNAFTFGAAQPPPPATLLTVFLPGVIPALQLLQSTIAGVLTPPTIPAAAAAPLQLTTAAASNTPSAVPNAAANTVTANTAKTVNTGAAAAPVATGAPGATGATAGPAAKVTTGTVTATTTSTTGITTGTTDLTGGNKATPGTGTKTASGAAGSTVSKIAAGLGGSGQPSKHGK